MPEAIEAIQAYVCEPVLIQLMYLAEGEYPPRELRLARMRWAIQDQDLLVMLHRLHYRGQPIIRDGPDGELLKLLPAGFLSVLDHVVDKKFLTSRRQAFEVCPPADQPLAAPNQLRLGFQVSHFLGLQQIEHLRRVHAEIPKTFN